MVDLVGERRVEVAQWIIGEGGQMYDRVEAGEVGFAGRACIPRPELLLAPGIPGAVIEVKVDPHHVIAIRRQVRGENTADVTARSRHEDTSRQFAHKEIPPILVSGPLRDSFRTRSPNTRLVGSTVGGHPVASAKTRLAEGG